MDRGSWQAAVHWLAKRVGHSDWTTTVGLKSLAWLLPNHVDVWQNSIETCILSSVKHIASPGWMHEMSAQDGCTGMTQRDGMGREVGGGFRMGNKCKSMADSCQCMAKTTTIL